MNLPEHFAVVSASRPGISEVEQRQVHDVLGVRLRELGFTLQIAALSGAEMKKHTGFDLTYVFIVPLTEDGFKQQMRTLWLISDEFPQFAIQLVSEGSVCDVVALVGESMSLRPTGCWSEVSDTFALTKDVYTIVLDQDTSMNRYYFTEFNVDISPPKSMMH